MSRTLVSRDGSRLLRFKTHDPSTVHMRPLRAPAPHFQSSGSTSGHGSSVGGSVLGDNLGVLRERSVASSTGPGQSRSQGGLVNGMGGRSAAVVLAERQTAAGSQLSRSVTNEEEHANAVGASRDVSVSDLLGGRPPRRSRSRSKGGGHKAAASDSVTCACTRWRGCVLRKGGGLSAESGSAICGGKGLERGGRGVATWVNKRLCVVPAVSHQCLIAACCIACCHHGWCRGFNRVVEAGGEWQGDFSRPSTGCECPSLPPGVSLCPRSCPLVCVDAVDLSGSPPRPASSGGGGGGTPRLISVGSKASMTARPQLDASSVPVTARADSGGGDAVFSSVDNIDGPERPGTAGPATSRTDPEAPYLVNRTTSDADAAPQRTFKLRLGGSKSSKVRVCLACSDVWDGGLQ